MNFGRLDVTLGRQAVVFRIRREELRREALLTPAEVRALIAHLEKLLGDLSAMAADTPAEEGSVFD